MNTLMRRKMIECMRRRAAHADLENRCQRIAELVGLSDREFLSCLRSLGRTREKIMLAHLAPLVQVAWADGRVNGRERTLIMNACRASGLTEGSAAFLHLTNWLDQRPSVQVFNDSLKLLGSVVQTLPLEKRGASRVDILALCVLVAEASGGMADYIGEGRISDEEQKAIKLLAERLHRVTPSPSLLPQAVGASRESTPQRRVA
jgi:hypothetical protein